MTGLDLSPIRTPVTQQVTCNLHDVMCAETPMLVTPNILEYGF